MAEKRLIILASVSQRASGWDKATCGDRPCPRLSTQNFAHSEPCGALAVQTKEGVLLAN